MLLHAHASELNIMCFTISGSQSRHIKQANVTDCFFTGREANIQ